MHPLARYDEFTLSHGGNTVQLRASLRAAMRLERLHDGFTPLFRKIDEFDTQTIKAVITIAATDWLLAGKFVASMEGATLRTFQQVAQGALASLCAAFFPPESADTASTNKQPVKALPWSEAYAQLYQIGTGWLNWTPAETWAATPTEITQALEGRIAHLIAMNGGSENTDDKTTSAEQRQDNIAAGLDPAFDRAGLHALRAKM